MTYTITSETPRRNIKVNKQIITCPAPFAEGHTLTETEADAMNQVFAENIRNNIVSRAKRAEEKGEAFDLQAEFDAYALEYEFGKRRAAEPVDPTEAEARKIARAKLVEALRAANIALKDVPREKQDQFVDQILAENPEIRKEAARRIKASAQVVLDGLDLSIDD